MAFASSVTVEEIEALEIASFPGVITVVQSSGSQEFDQAMEYLNAQQAIGFDTETKPCFVPKVPRNKMAILQLSGPDRAYIFRLQQVGVPPKLAALLGNPNILKIGAAVHDDIRGLQEYRKFIPKGFVDLQRLAPAYGIEEKSVRKMSAIILKKRVSKSQQLSNWESSHLSEAQLRYAAIDAWICREMYYKLMAERSE
ncbi:MAG: 3'-5' exonuclease domain-containing protein 2 [Bacteroidales bacterium]|nr:3'-5' exonuclease domain-containing protein 2 [Bacteroidales bacterium]MBR1950672.1 3'-5' exonuclease domain-containing protein 2 [Bacteroidales bacterium]MBR2438127.1 3'-5' exonuclease domain-containing protein 2 [Bacteroidales bacterium]MBR4088821.1 3'-5' exonuclease domain-containing protein 2 [Bacteroidales bacterium]